MNIKLAPAIYTFSMSTKGKADPTIRQIAEQNPIPEKQKDNKL